MLSNSAASALSRLKNQGLIKSFEFTYELAWNTLRDYLTFQGISGLTGSRNTSREAFKRQVVTDGEGWMMMLSDRNRSSHMYDEATANEIADHIHHRYLGLFRQLSETLEAHIADE